MEAMLDLGYDDIAKICLTHTFPAKQIDKSQFNWSYEWLEWAQTELDKIEYDDYDRLIQLCDQLSDDIKYMSLESRSLAIAKRYGMSEEQRQILCNNSTLLKDYFENKFDIKIYELLGIEEKNAKI